MSRSERLVILLLPSWTRLHITANRYGMFPSWTIGILYQQGLDSKGNQLRREELTLRTEELTPRTHKQQKHMREAQLRRKRPNLKP